MNHETIKISNSPAYDGANENKTMYVPSDRIKTARLAASPAVVVQQEDCIEMIALSGVQLLGRSTPSTRPDIAVSAPFVSREHGRFETAGTCVRFTALKSTNGTYFQGRRLKDMETITLQDGDVLQIYAGGGISSDVTLECAFSRDSQKNWRNVIKGQHDALTGLMGRKLFSSWFANNRRMFSGESAYVFVLDVDHFKSINDTYGHKNGDLALIQLARTLESELRASGRAARWGGDEFVGFICADKAAAARSFEKIRDSLDRTLVSNRFTVSISVGLTPLTGHDQESLEKLLDRADKALYAAKQNGRRQIVFTA